jgi:hypothetical protein
MPTVDSIFYFLAFQALGIGFPFAMAAVLHSLRKGQLKSDWDPDKY